MSLLAIDYGQKKVGLAIAISSLAEPLVTIKYESEGELIRKVEEVVQIEQVKKVVVGVSKGSMAQKIKSFAQRLSEKLDIPIEFEDETLTSKEAQRLAIEAGIKRKKRKALEDAYAATIILQSYLDKRL